MWMRLYCYSFIDVIRHDIFKYQLGSQRIASLIVAQQPHPMSLVSKIVSRNRVSEVVPRCPVIIVIGH